LVERFVFDVIGSATGLGAYGLVFGILMACGLGFPLPEDVALITGGYLAYKGQANLWIMIGVGFGGILLGDSLIFLLGRLGRKAEGKIAAGLLGRHLTPERIAKVEAQFERRGSMMVVIARFLPGIRAATYFVAGGARMSYWRFLVFDGIAALLSAPVFVLLGHHFGNQIRVVVGWAEQFHTWLIGGMLGLAVILLGRWLLQRRKAVPATVAAQRDPTQPGPGHPDPGKTEPSLRLASSRSAPPQHHPVPAPTPRPTPAGSRRSVS
jgi:membrane protein DedA with SNARE-associated domain